jgi:hypothetical protein
MEGRLEVPASFHVDAGEYEYPAPVLKRSRKRPVSEIRAVSPRSRAGLEWLASTV